MAVNSSETPMAFNATTQTTIQTIFCGNARRRRFVSNLFWGQWDLSVFIVLTFFLRSKLGVCRVRFEGNKGQTMRGKARLPTDKIRCEASVKQEDFIGGERSGGVWP